MSNGITKNQVYNQIAELQKNLDTIYNILLTFRNVNDSQSFVRSEDGEPILLEDGTPIVLDYSTEVALEKIDAIRNIVLERENTINKMLDFCIKLYQDLEKDEKE